MEIPNKKFPKIDLARLSSFQEILENAIRCHWKIPENLTWSPFVKS